MNSRGTPQNLKAAHPGNRNAARAGVYSTAMREERARALKKELARRPFGEVVEDIRLQDLAGLLALRDLLDADIVVNGVTSGRGKSRRQADLLVSVSRRIAHLVKEIEEEAAAQG